MRNNVADTVINGLPQRVTTLIKTAGKAAAGSGFPVYLVGGIVRDLMLGRASKDIDIMVEGDALTVAESLSETLSSTPTTHKRFGTATFQLDDYRIDLATCRTETYDRPGSLPRVKPGNIGQDLFRRDFTVNAMAICISPKQFGEIIDIYGGLQDLEKGMIRILHEQSFQDDATRMMRAVRYEQRLDFKLERKTAGLLRRDVDMLDTISGDRLRHEVSLWLGESQPEKILKRAAALGILTKLHPALTWNASLNSAFQTAARISDPFQTEQLFLSLLVYNLNPKQLGEFLARLNIRGGGMRNIATHTIALKENRQLLDHDPIQPSEVYRVLKDFNIAAITANALLTKSRAVRMNAMLYLDKLRFIKPRINGRDLEAMGMPQGRNMGIILDKLLAARLDGEVKSRAGEERLALKLMSDL
jgi:tRNA nucleotidyltransferase (CCA-adding enzyme)